MSTMTLRCFCHGNAAKWTILLHLCSNLILPYFYMIVFFQFNGCEFIQFIFFYRTKLSLSAFLCLDELKWNETLTYFKDSNFPILHRWRNYWIRGVLSLPMISGFSLMIYLGPIALILVVSDGDRCCSYFIRPQYSDFSVRCVFLQAEKEIHHFRRLTLFILSLTSPLLPLFSLYSSYRLMQVMTVQIKCFQEIITIGYRVYRSYELPWFRTLSW